MIPSSPQLGTPEALCTQRFVSMPAAAKGSFWRSEEVWLCPWLPLLQPICYCCSHHLWNPFKPCKISKSELDFAPKWKKAFSTCFKHNPTCPFVVLQGIKLKQNKYHEEGSYLLLKEKGFFSAPARTETFLVQHEAPFQFNKHAMTITTIYLALHTHSPALIQQFVSRRHWNNPPFLPLLPSFILLNSAVKNSR